MFKKLLVAIISMNICFSGLAYAQYQPQGELTAEEVEEYMKGIENKGKEIPSWVTVLPVVTSAGVLLALRYANTLNRSEKIAAVEWKARMAKDGKFLRKAKINIKKLLLKAKKNRGKLAILTVAAILVYSYFDENNREETAIFNNRALLDRKIKELMENDIDSLALYVYSLSDEQKKVAYSILADNPEIFEIIKQQVEEAFSEGNIKAAEEVYNALESEQEEELLLQKKNELIDSLRQSEENFSPAWSFGE